MSLFRFQWLRKFIRKNMNPIPEESAHIWKKRLSIGYMLLAWNGFGLVLYMIYSGEGDWARKYQSDEWNALSPAQQWSRTLGITNAKVYRISGFKVTEYEIQNDFDKNSENKITSSDEPELEGAQH